jgi:hypothetical protein
MSNNDPPISPSKVVGFTTRTKADEYLMAHPDGALGALHLIRQGPDKYSYIVTSNSTVRERCKASLCVYVGGGGGGGEVQLAAHTCVLVGGLNRLQAQVLLG